MAPTSPTLTASSTRHAAASRSIIIVRRSAGQGTTDIRALEFERHEALKLGSVAAPKLSDRPETELETERPKGFFNEETAWMLEKEDRACLWRLF